MWFEKTDNEQKEAGTTHLNNPSIARSYKQNV